MPGWGGLEHSSVWTRSSTTSTPVQPRRSTSSTLSTSWGNKGKAGSMSQVHVKLCNFPGSTWFRPGSRSVFIAIFQLIWLLLYCDAVRISLQVYPTSSGGQTETEKDLSTLSQSASQSCVENYVRGWGRVGWRPNHFASRIVAIVIRIRLWYISCIYNGTGIIRGSFF